jgi:hypothetical protein
MIIRASISSGKTITKWMSCLLAISVPLGFNSASQVVSRFWKIMKFVVLSLNLSSYLFFSPLVIEFFFIDGFILIMTIFTMSQLLLSLLSFRKVRHAKWRPIFVITGWLMIPTKAVIHMNLYIKLILFN